MIKAVIFDCFGVIYIDANQAAFKLLKIPNNPEMAKGYRQIMDARCLGYLDRAEARRQMAELVGVSLDRWNEAIMQVKGRDPELLELIHTLKRQGLKIGLLSNAGKNQLQELFTAEEQAELFDAAVVSGDIGIIKPDPEIYRYIAEQLGVAPEECLFIDDNSSYCEGARMVGMQVIHYRDLEVLLKELADLGVITDKNE